jgi:hypothetical protein
VEAIIPPTIGAALHDLRSRAMAPECRQQAEHDGGHCHQLGAKAVHGSLFDRPGELRPARAAFTTCGDFPGVVQVEQHDDAGFRATPASVMNPTATAIDRL